MIRRDDSAQRRSSPRPQPDSNRGFPLPRSSCMPYRRWLRNSATTSLPRLARSSARDSAMARRRKGSQRSRNWLKDLRWGHARPNFFPLHHLHHHHHPPPSPPVLPTGYCLDCRYLPHSTDRRLRRARRLPRPGRVGHVGPRPRRRRRVARRLVAARRTADRRAEIHPRYARDAPEICT